MIYLFAFLINDELEKPVARGYLWLFSLYINIKIGKNGFLMLNLPVTKCMGNCRSPGCRL